MSVSTALLRRFEDLSREDVAYAGGKGANLGEMTAAGLPGPAGLRGRRARLRLPSATVGGLRERIAERLEGLDVDDTEALAAAAAEVREMVEAEPIPGRVEEAIRGGYCGARRGLGQRPGGRALLGDRRGHRRPPRSRG